MIRQRVRLEEVLLSKPNTKRGPLQRAALACLREHEATGNLPTNGQFIWYELVQKGVVPKHNENSGGRTPKQHVCDALLYLREKGLFPWEWIIDETCTVTQWQYGADVAD